MSRAGFFTPVALGALVGLGLTSLLRSRTLATQSPASATARNDPTGVATGTAKDTGFRSTTGQRVLHPVRSS